MADRFSRGLDDLDICTGAANCSADEHIHGCYAEWRDARAEQKAAQEEFDTEAGNLGVHHHGPDCTDDSLYFGTALNIGCLVQREEADRG